MRNYLLVATILALTCINAISAEKHFIHANGYGPVTIGMTNTEASNALGERLTPAVTIDPLDEETKLCHYVYPSGDYNNVAFMVENGLITRVDVHNNRYFTDTGITVGQNERKVHEAYKNKVTEQIHPYIGKEGKYLIVAAEKGFQIIFETDRGKITGFRTGKLPSVSYVEGCL